ncbi:MAG: hypothetical protein JWO86_7565 [Myxococcaceae bacterium]|nr:hypothetical protein [Myxococcaceae bacterium]
MKTSSLLPALLPLALAAFAMGCASQPAPATDASMGNPTVQPDDTANTPSTPGTPSPSEAPAAAPAAAPADGPHAPAITTAKIHAAPVWTYAVANDAVFVATDVSVERTAADGSAVTKLPGLDHAMSLATDGTRIYGLLDQGASAELFSAKPDGSDSVHHLSWNWGYGEPGALAVHDNRVYFSASNWSQRSNSMLVSVASATPASAYDNPWRIEEYVDAQNVAPAFTADRLFAVDYYRQSAVRVSIVDASQSVDVIQDAVPVTAGGIATDGKDVFTRTSAGIVKVAIGSGANSAPIVVVPSAACSIFDPADGSESMLDDALVVDGTTIYTACRAGANVEIRAYGMTGTLAKTVATVPYAGGVSHLRVNATAAYWLSKPSADSLASELWRSAK